MKFKTILIVILILVLIYAAYKGYQSYVIKKAAAQIKAAPPVSGPAPSIDLSSGYGTASSTPYAGPCMCEKDPKVLDMIKTYENSSPIMQSTYKQIVRELCPCINI